ncbi:sigma factor [Clostridium polynesiense]|uniref:sigma factor n=1 Tax=Clostridium polynesiense TaxID=1325933 RepID=UPI00058F369F|nr:sigma factor [Clostridium polynesiense]
MEQSPLLQTNRDNFIEENKGFIYNIACSICKRKLDWKNDDELSIALISFNNACDSYDEGKGAFPSYAKVLIKNSLIDFFRRSQHIPYLIFDKEDENFDYVDYKSSMVEFNKYQENLQRAYEISVFSKELAEYRLSMEDLVKSSPSHADTRNVLLNAAFVCSKEKAIINYIRVRKTLPIKEMILLTGHNRKFFDKWRRYLLVLILILSSSNYPYIKSYLNIKVGESHD